MGLIFQRFNGTEWVTEDIGGDVSISNHASLTNLTWKDSKHTGEADKYAGFDSDGNAVNLEGGGGGGTIPIGSIMPYPMASAPTGYEVCDGGLLSRTTFSDLFNVIGTDYGAGDGSTTFNKPDYRGVFLRGSGEHASMVKADGTPFDGGIVGDENDDLLQGHEHATILTQATTHRGTNASLFKMDQSNGKTTGILTNDVDGTPRTGNETSPANIAVTWIIRATNVSVTLVDASEYTASTIPIGSSMAWGESSAPVGYLKNDGSAVSRTTYSDLFAKIGTTYGSGDGSTTFNLPKSDFDSGWVSASTFIANALITITHGLVSIIDNLDFDLLIRDPLVPDAVFDGIHVVYSSGDYGQTIQGLVTGSSSDLLNKINIRIGGVSARYMSSTGLGIIAVTNKEYRIIVKRKDFPKNSIIRATNTSVTLEEVSSDIIADLTVTNSATIEDLEVNGSHPDLLGTDYTVLADYPTRKYNGIITLSEALTNFEYLVIKGQYYISPYNKRFTYIPTALINIGDVTSFWRGDGAGYSQWSYTNPTTFTYKGENISWIRTVYGMGRKV